MRHYPKFLTWLYNDSQWENYIYHLQTKLQKGNAFTPVCHSVHSGEVYTPLGRDPPGRHPPQTATAANGMHPTGI